MKKIDMVKMLGLAGMVLGGLASMITEHARSKQMEQTIEEKVNEALAKRENGEES